MTTLHHEIRRGAYHDSIVLMQLQAALAERPGILDAGAVMATRENLALLKAGELLPAEAEEAGPEDLLVVVRGETRAAAVEALGRLDDLLVRGSRAGEGYRPRSFAAAARLLPGARWVLVSVPGRFAAGVAREALHSSRHVFLYSDNVTLAEEVALKEEARRRGLLVMGPDCGTALVNGIGFGFSNRVRRGRIGLVAASGTGLQAVSCRIHQLGAGVSHAIGTGGRDLSAAVGGISALQGLDLLARDPGTDVIVLISKPPEPAVAERLLDAAGRIGKPVVVRFLGDDTAGPAGVSGEPSGGLSPKLHFADGLGAAATLAVGLEGESGNHRADPRPPGAGPRDGGGPRAEGGDGGRSPSEPGQIETPSRRRFLRGLFAGGTLALEALPTLRDRLGRLETNLGAAATIPVRDPGRSRGHTILDLGGDEFTRGRLHPMIDQSLRLKRIRQEARDPETGIILLDVILGDGAHPDPASELAPAVAAAHQKGVRVVVVMVGTEEDPQGLEEQSRCLEEAGASLFPDAAEAASFACHLLSREDPGPPAEVAGITRPTVEPAAPPPASHSPGPPVPLEDLQASVAAIGVGLEVFHDSLLGQGAEAVRVEWSPPAGGDERLLEILRKMQG